MTCPLGSRTWNWALGSVYYLALDLNDILLGHIGVYLPHSGSVSLYLCAAWANARLSRLSAAYCCGSSRWAVARTWRRFFRFGWLSRRFYRLPAGTPFSAFQHYIESPASCPAVASTTLPFSGIPVALPFTAWSVSPGRYRLWQWYARSGPRGCRFRSQQSSRYPGYTPLRPSGLS